MNKCMKYQPYRCDNGSCEFLYKYLSSGNKKASTRMEVEWIHTFYTVTKWPNRYLTARALFSNECRKFSWRYLSLAFG